MATTLRPARLRLRPIGIAAAALGIAVATYGVAALRATPPPIAIPGGPAAANGGAGLSGGAAAAGPGHEAGSQAVVSPGGPVSAVATVAQLDHAIQVWTANLAKEPRDFYSATTLGQLYEARARLTGDVSDYDRARQALQQAITVAPTEIDARIVHARVLASLHDFSGALAETQAILRDDPTQLAALATSGDAELELGDVEGAAAAYASLAKAAPGAAVDARLSRLAFIQGRPDDAWRFARQAYDEAASEGQSGPSLSWYAYVLGSLALPAGHPSDALAWFERARSAWPGSFLANAGVARAEAALGRSDAAIHDYGLAIAISPQPDSLASLGDLYGLQGNARLANQEYATVEAIGHLATINEQVFNRQLVLFSVNHDRDLGQALTLAQDEIAVRKDAYGFDALAWALLANGRPADAQVAMGQAMAFGTVDPLFEYHAGLIAQALGERSHAIALLDASLAPTGGLDPLATSRAAAALVDLEGTR